MNDTLDVCVTGMTNPQIRAMICSLKPEIEIAKNGDEWEFKMYTTQSTRNVSFTSGQEIDTLSIVGKPVKVMKAATMSAFLLHNNDKICIKHFVKPYLYL